MDPEPLPGKVSFFDFATQHGLQPGPIQREGLPENLRARIRRLKISPAGNVLDLVILDALPAAEAAAVVEEYARIGRNPVYGSRPTPRGHAVELPGGPSVQRGFSGPISRPE